MKLLQINELDYVNPETIENIEDCDDDYCYVELKSGKIKCCDIYSAQQLMSKICEEVYYGNDGICKEDK